MQSHSAFMGFLAFRRANAPMARIAEPNNGSAPGRGTGLTELLDKENPAESSPTK
jgi:hypothetical protein